MKVRVALSLAALGLPLALTSPSHAQTSPPPLAPQPASDDGVVLAKQRFAAGKAAFEAGRYEDAIREFEAARAIRPSPLLEYNIALAYERLGRADLALAGYERYLAQHPAAENRNDVEERIRELRASLAQNGAYGTTPPLPPAPASGEPLSATPPGPVAGTPAAPSLAPAEIPPPDSPAVPQRRFAVGARLGVASSGGLGEKALAGLAPLDSSGKLFALNLRLLIPESAFAVEALVESLSFDGKGKMGMVSLGSKFSWAVRAKTRPIEVAFAGGFDVVLSSFRYPTMIGTYEETGLSPSYALVVEAPIFRILLGAEERLELVLSPLRLRFLDKMSSGGRQIQLGDLKVSAAQALDLDKRSTSYAVQVGLGYRF